MISIAFKKHLFKGFLIGGLTVISLNSPDLTAKTLSHKGFMIILANHYLIIKWSYNLKLFIDDRDLYNFWKKCMKIHYGALIIAIIGRSYRLFECYYKTLK